MIITMILIFVFGYLCIALEHKLRIDKAAIALLMCGALWTVLSLLGNDAQIGTQLIEQLGDTSEILFFLIGAMTIVELIDRHGGFHVITDHIKTRNKRKLLWLLSIIAFFMSAVLDNMTTTIIMIMLLRRVIGDQKERWIFASVIVIAANSGGAFSPIGDVTTIMLWMRGNVTSGLLVAKLFLPALVSIIIPTAIACRYIPDEDVRPEDFDTNQKLPPFVGPRFSHFVLVLGVGGLLFVPVFKAVTGLPPYLGMLISLGVLWVFTEIVYDQKHNMEESIKNRVSKVLKHIDMPTIPLLPGHSDVGLGIAERRSADRLRRLPGQKRTRSLYDRRNHRPAVGRNRQRAAGGCLYGHVPRRRYDCPGLEPRPGLYAGVRTGRYLLASADFLRRRGRQPADYRIGRRRSGDGTGKDRIRLVPA